MQLSEIRHISVFKTWYDIPRKNMGFIRAGFPVLKLPVPISLTSTIYLLNVHGICSRTEEPSGILFHTNL